MVKTMRQIEEEARNLPKETKQEFWRLMLKEHKNLGEAKEIAGIEDTRVAVALVILCHDNLHMPKRVEEIE